MFVCMTACFVVFGWVCLVGLFGLLLGMSGCCFVFGRCGFVLFRLVWFCLVCVVLLCLSVLFVAFALFVLCVVFGLSGLFVCLSCVFGLFVCVCVCLPLVVCLLDCVVACLFD